MTREPLSFARVGYKPAAHLVPRHRPMGCISQEPRFHPRSHSPRSSSPDSFESVHLIPVFFILTSTWTLCTQGLLPAAADSKNGSTCTTVMCIFIRAHRRRRAHEGVAQRIRRRIAAESIPRQEFDRFRREVYRETACRVCIANIRLWWMENNDEVIQEFQPLRNARSSAGTPGVLE